jgi:uncharacterized membrane protein YhaH (DUF805 family)
MLDFICMGKVRTYFGVNDEKIGRRKYFFANATAYVIYFGILLAIKPFLLPDGSNVEILLVAPIILFFSIAELYIYVFSSLNRLDDIGVSRWFLIQYTSQLAASVLTRELLPFSRWQTTYDDHITRHS